MSNVALIADLAKAHYVRAGGKIEFWDMWDRGEWHEVARNTLELLTAANLLIVPRAVVEEAHCAAQDWHYMELVARLRACIPAAADKQGAG